MRPGPIAFVFCAACAVGVAPPAEAQRNRDEIYSSLERMGDAAARIESEFCGADLARIFQGAIDGINAMPARRGEPPLRMQTPGMRDFADAYGNLLDSSADRAALESAAINGMVHAIDPTGNYRPANAARAGPGAVMMTLSNAGATLRVVSPDPDGPAARAGVQAGDLLTAIDGQSTHGLALNEVVDRLRGEIGSSVTLTLERDGAPISLSVERERAIARPAVHSRAIENIGVITISGFPDGTGPAARDAVRRVRREIGAPAGYIIDLRDNGGGLLDQVIETTEPFVDGGPVLTVRPFGDCRQDEVQTYHAHRRNETRGARLIVLISADTASGAELLAATLRERAGAILVGQASFGQNRVHTEIPLNGGRDGFFRLSTGVLTTPSGVTWDDAGLAPDIATEARNASSDATLDGAVALLRETAARQ